MGVKYSLLTNTPNTPNTHKYMKETTQVSKVCSIDFDQVTEDNERVQKEINEQIKKFQPTIDEYSRSDEYMSEQLSYGIKEIIEENFNQTSYLSFINCDVIQKHLEDKGVPKYYKNKQVYNPDVIVGKKCKMLKEMVNSANKVQNNKLLIFKYLDYTRNNDGLVYNCKVNIKRKNKTIS